MTTTEVHAGGRGRNSCLCRCALCRDGFAVLPGVVPKQTVAFLRSQAERLVQLHPVYVRGFAFQGSLIPLRWNSDIVSPLQLDSFTSTLSDHSGCSSTDWRWYSGHVISKPPGGKPLWWHQDWWAWDLPVSRDHQPVQVAALIYLVPTDSKNGALRVLPRSHHRSHELHSTLPEAHSVEANALPDDHLAFRTYPGEECVEAEEGDVVLLDYRTLHSTHGNASHVSRPCIHLSYLLNYSSLGSSLRDHLNQGPSQPTSWERRALGADEGLFCDPVRGDERSRDLVRRPTPRSMHGDCKEVGARATSAPPASSM